MSEQDDMRGKGNVNINSVLPMQVFFLPFNIFDDTNFIL